MYSGKVTYVSYVVGKFIFQTVINLFISLVSPRVTEHITAKFPLTLRQALDIKPYL